MHTCPRPTLREDFRFCPYCGKQLTQQDRIWYRYEGQKGGHKNPPASYAIPTGEFREPKKGEYFISGAEPMAYLAYNDLSMKYHIAKIVHTNIPD